MKRTALLLSLLSAALLGLAGSASADTCTCNIYVYSAYRWMDPWWGLECQDHCGHGYVGSGCDIGHSVGCGAMIGYVRIRNSNGSTIRNLACPDDHTTCFRGPSDCDGGGSWANICNADIEHCVPGGRSWQQGAFDCNAMSSSESVFQTYTWGAVFPGACGTNWFNVLEFVEENDDPCCDDSMGYINVSTWTAEGHSTTFLSGGDQNCNGGSQGGVYPHCGKFGATLKIESQCFTTYGGSGGGGGGGEDPPPPPALAVLNAQLEQGIEEQRQALADSLFRRERQLAATPRHVVEAEVAERARILGVRASAQALTKLLWEAATAELARDRCRLEHPGEKASACGDLERRLVQLDDAFQKLSGGVAIREFRSGSTGPPPEPVAPAPRH